MFKKILFLAVVISTNVFSANLVDLDTIVAEKNTDPNTEFQDYLKNNKLVVVEFYSPTCSHCQNMVPILQGVANDYAATDVLFLKVPDKYHSIFEKYKVAGLPTFMYVKDGQKKHKRGGALTASALKEQIKQHLGV